MSVNRSDAMGSRATRNENVARELEFRARAAPSALTARSTSTAVRDRWLRAWREWPAAVWIESDARYWVAEILEQGTFLSF